MVYTYPWHKTDKYANHTTMKHWVIHLGSQLRCNGVNNGCCTKDNPCGKGDGDCDNDSECAGDLVCGRNNCKWGGYDDCCIAKKRK